MRLIFPAIFAFLGSSCATRLSATGESCSRTADCHEAARCVAQTCVEVATDARLGTIDDLARAVATAVASGQVEQLDRLVLTEGEFDALVATSSLPGDELTEARARFRAERGRLGERWRRLEEDAAKRGFALIDLRFDSLRPYRVGREEGLTLVDGDLEIKVSVEGRRDLDHLVLEVELCVETPSGWRLASPEVEFEERASSGEASTGEAPVEAPPEVPATGAKLLERYGCTACHAVSANGPALVGPGLFGLFGRTTDTNRGPIPVDERYLREAILTPGATVVTGYQNVMPSYLKTIPASDLDALIAHLEGLGP